MGEWLEGTRSKWMLGILGALLVIWLLLRRGSSSQPQSVIVQSGTDPGAAQAMAQAASAQSAAQAQAQAIVAQAQAASDIANINAQNQTAQVVAQSQAALGIANINAQNQTAQIIAQSQAALGVANAGYSAQTAQANYALQLGKYNADAAVAIAKDASAADVRKTISGNQTQVQLYGIQAGVANNAIDSAAAVDLATVGAQHEESMATIQGQLDTAQAYYAAAAPLARQQLQDQQTRFNTLSTILSGNKVLNHGTPQVEAGNVAAFLALVNPDSAYSGNLAQASVGVAATQAKASILQSIIGAITKTAPLVFA